jgi:N-acetylneuraminic acid mutarotase
MEKDFWEYDPALNTWTKKADFGGGVRWYATGFGIGSKGYIGTGGSTQYGITVQKDLWEYDPVLNTWTKKADFPGVARWYAVGFGIGMKGYIGTGQDSNFTYQKDLWDGPRRPTFPVLQG